MTAKEMFEALGYTAECYSNNIVYRKSDGFKRKYFRWRTFSFYIEEKGFIATWNELPAIVTMEEYKAITQQMKELGWIEQ